MKVIAEPKPDQAVGACDCGYVYLIDREHAGPLCRHCTRVQKNKAWKQRQRQKQGK